MPDGCVELIFNLAAPFKRYHPNHQIEIQPLALVAGQMRHYAMLQPTGRVKLFGIRFHPGGAFPFLHLPLNELTDQIVSLNSVWHNLSSELAERMHAARSTCARITFMETVLLARLAQQHQTDPLVNAVVNRIIQRNGLVAIEPLQKNLGISGRQLERKFQTFIGLTPKFLCRILRFQKVFRAVEYPEAATWSHVALECGYYDQAHFIHDFKAFTGQNPSAYFGANHPMSEYFTRKHRLSDFYNTME